MNLNFGENLKKLRRSLDMTQDELAEALGLSAAMKRSQPTLI